MAAVLSDITKAADHLTESAFAHLEKGDAVRLTLHIAEAIEMLHLRIVKLETATTADVNPASTEMPEVLGGKGAGF